MIIELIALSAIAAASPANSVAGFFDVGDRQLESKSQCRELETALTDILNKKPSALRQKRYKDYQGKVDKWSITELLGKYYFSPRGLPKENEFFRDYRKKPAKLAVKSQIAQLGECSSYAGD